MSQLVRGRTWLCVLLCCLIGAGPALSAPRTRASHGVVRAPQRARAKAAAPGKSARKPVAKATAKKTTAAAAKKTAAGKASAAGAKKPAGGKAAAATAKKATGGKATAKQPPRRVAATPARRGAKAPPPTVARVTIAGAARGPSEPRGRGPSLATTPDERTADAIDELLQGPLRWGTTGLYVVDAVTGHELFAIHPDDPLNPASNVKLVSTAAALDLLGPDFRYTTRLLGPTPDADGVVAGDVYLNGTYDPTLAVGGLDELAATLAARGVHAIDGDLVVGGPSTRDGIYRARVRVDVSAAAPGQPPHVAVAPATDFLEIVNTATTGKRARVKGKGITVTSALIERNGRTRLQLTIAGTIGKGKSTSRGVSTKERHLYAAHLVRTALGRAGVTVRGDVHTAELDAFVDAAGAAGHLPIVLAQHASAPLGEIVAHVNKRSINWLSDRIIATAAALTADEQPSMSRGIDAMYAWLDRNAGVGRKEAVLDTGSGLSYRTELSPRQIVRVLRAATGAEPPADAHQAACAEAFRDSLSVGGVDGTLRGRFRSELRGRVRGKTGTLSNVIALSGLIEGKGGRALAFSIVTNGHERRRKLTVRSGHEQLLAVLDRYLSETTPAAPAAAPIAAPPTAPTVAPDVLDDEGSLEAGATAGEVEAPPPLGEPGDTAPPAEPEDDEADPTAGDGDGDPTAGPDDDDPALDDELAPATAPGDSGS